MNSFGIPSDGVRLHLGCGKKYLEGWCNVDRSESVKADVHHDLEKIPWPFADGSVSHIEMDAVIEHLHNTLEKLAEVHRILKPGGTIHISTGYFKSSCAFLDPTHVSFFHERTMDFVREGYDYNFYVPFRFEVLDVKLVGEKVTLLQRLRNLIPGRKFLNYFLWNMYDRIEYVLRKPKSTQ